MKGKKARWLFKRKREGMGSNGPERRRICNEVGPIVVAADVILRIDLTDLRGMGEKT
jgi:hypothetical protein